MNLRLNVKTELLNMVTVSDIRCAQLNIWHNYPNYINQDFIDADLVEGYNEEQLSSFLNKIDMEYIGGHNSQQVFGTVWLKNGKWLERCEYDGDEWWAECCVPEIPNKLKQ